MSAAATDGLRRERLPNGLTLLVRRRREAPAVALVAHVRAGFLDEPDDVAGISHVLEHMLFKGTPTMGPGELARRTKALGGSLNAYTSYDRTVYYATVPAASARDAILLQADQVRRPLFDADELRRELGVIIQEARRKLDTPSALVGETLHELLYATHRIRRWRIGTETMLEGLTREPVAAYHASRYVPARTILSAVGDLPEEALLDALRAAWGDWTATADPPPPSPRETTAPTGAARLLRGDVAMADLVIGWRGVGPLDPASAAFDVTAALLAAGRSGRLVRTLRETGLAGGVGASHYGGFDPEPDAPGVGVMAIGADLLPERLDAVLEGIGGVLHDLRERPVDTDELARVRALLGLRIRRRLERFEAHATALAAAEAGGDVTRLDREEEELLAVTPEAVRELVAERLTPERAAAVLHVPRDAEVGFDAARLHDALAAAAPRRPPSVGGTIATRPAVPIPRGRRGDAHGVHHLALDGVDLLAARHGAIPQATIAVHRLRDDPEDAATAGLAAWSVRAMLRGTRRLDTGELAAAAERLGGVVSPLLGADSVGFGLTVMAEHLGAAGALLAEVLAEPRLAPDGLAIERRLLLDDARAVADDMVRFPLQLLLGQAFGDRGYGAPATGTEASLEALSEAAVPAWHRRMLEHGRTTVVVTGAIDPARAVDALAAAFATLPVARPVAPSSADPPIAAGARTAHRARRQSALAMLFPGPSRRDPARWAAEVWSGIAGGLGGTLFEALRSRRSLAYTVIASSWQRRRAGGLLGYIACAPERLDEARAAMLEELAGFAAAPPAEDELRRAVTMLAGQARIARQSAAALAGEIADAWLLGEGLAELDDPGAGYLGVTGEDVRRLAETAFAAGPRAEGVVTGGEPG